MSSDFIYLDYAAATPMSDAVKQAMEPYLQDMFYNPSATYLPSRRAKEALDAARQSVAETLGARASEVTFTAGGTEANNLAIHGIMSSYPTANMVTTAIEHESVLEPGHRFKARIAPVAQNGIVEPTQLRAHIDDQTVLVSVMYANNEVGTVQPLRAIAEEIDGVRKQRRREGNKLPLYLHTDAAQAANYLDLHVARLGVDLMTLNGGKIYGPKQSGVLYVRGGISLQPLILGGGQERGLRSGTENVAAAIGFAAALKATQERRHDEGARLGDMQHVFFKELQKKIPGASINGSTSRRLPNNMHLTFSGVDNERLLLELEQAGILAAAGSACSASNEKPSHVLAAMGLSEEQARSSLRFTMGRQTTEADTAQLLAVLSRLVG